MCARAVLVSLATTTTAQPNFPGRCSHYCNIGLIVAPAYRRKNLGRLAGELIIRLARDIGYAAIMLNLVFTVNEPAVKLWSSLGFQRLSLLPGVGDFTDRGLGVSDAQQFLLKL